jgi:hypothetical protein
LCLTGAQTLYDWVPVFLLSVRGWVASIIVCGGGCEICRGLQARQYMTQNGEYIACILQNKSGKGEIIGKSGEINSTRYRSDLFYHS